MAVNLTRNADSDVYGVNKYFADSKEELDTVNTSRLLPGSTALVVSEGGSEEFILNGSKKWISLAKKTVSDAGATGVKNITKEDNQLVFSMADGNTIRIAFPEGLTEERVREIIQEYVLSKPEAFIKEVIRPVVEEVVNEKINDVSTEDIDNLF